MELLVQTHRSKISNMLGQEEKHRCFELLEGGGPRSCVSTAARGTIATAATAESWPASTLQKTGFSELG